MRPVSFPTPPTLSRQVRTTPSRHGLWALATLALATSLHAQNRTIVFDVDAPGEDKSIDVWGLDTAWLWDQNVIRGVEFMGKERVDVIRFSFTGDKPITNGELEASRQAEFDERMRIVDTYTEADTQLYFNNDSEGIDPYFRGTNGINAERWAELINLTLVKANAAGRTVAAVGPFNEPDYTPNNLGDGARLREVVNLLRNDPRYADNFRNVRMAGGFTLNNDRAMSYYSTNKDLLDEGGTHQLAGTFDTYAQFFSYVVAQGDMGTNDELHNVMEAMVGAEYGMDGGIWWGSAEYARGEFVKASDGKRLGYAEHRPNWTAASVYRAPDGRVQAFVGESERQALPTTYLFVSKDRDVYFDGAGPQRTLTVSTTGGSGYQTTAHKNAERVVAITWGEDIQPKITGRYTIVNRLSGKVLEVQNGGTDNGTNIVINDAMGTDYQSWLVNPLTATAGGDWSYYTLRPFHSQKSADVWDWGLFAGTDIRQYDFAGGTNQNWVLEYAEDGYFYIRSRHNGKYFEVANAATAAGSNVQIGDGPGGYHQQWRLLPVGAAVEFVAPATPTGLQATAQAAAVTLSWAANSEADLAGYNVYRAKSPEGPFEMIARGLTTTTYTDNQANEATSYTYKLAAADKSLNRSDFSSLVTVTPSGAPTLVASLPFENNLNDTTPNGNTGTVVGFSGFVAGVNSTRALGFNGSTSYSTMPPRVASFDELTIAVRVYWSGTTANQRVYDFNNGESEYLAFTPKASNGNAQFAMKLGEEEVILNAPGFTAGTIWTHVAVTVGNGMASLYINGAKVDSQPTTVKPSDISPALNYLGKSHLATDPYFYGRIDDLQIYNFALDSYAVAGVAGNASTANDWRQAFFGTTANSGNAADLADPDGDGLANLLERGFASDPTMANDSVLPQFMTGTSGAVQLVYRKSKLATDLTFTVEETASPSGTWQAATGTSEVLDDNGIFQTIRFSRPVSGDQPLFLRVRIQ